MNVGVDARTLHLLFRSEPLSLPWPVTRGTKFLVSYHEYIAYCDLVAAVQPSFSGRWNANRLDIRQIARNFGASVRLCSPDADWARFVDGMKRAYHLDDREATNVLVLEQEGAVFCADERGLSVEMEIALSDRRIPYAVRRPGRSDFALTTGLRPEV